MDLPRDEQEAFGLSSSAAGDLWVITVAGELDFTTLDPLERARAEALRTHSGPIAFDLSGVGFCDSSLLNLLLLTRRQRRVLLIGVTRQTQRLLDVTGTASVFEQYATVPDAVAGRAPLIALD
ncbi:STAS domain-containing protein [Streptomyces sp. cg28]|uniref:STAS domain-containing protein n=1 Tax=Streptomyces sp. cg28 TaxID=3403457 RepID=UPI003B210D3D